MNKIFLTSDLHFNHKNILAYEPTTRPFDTIEDMNETLISNWNKVVDDEDTVYVVGDFILGSPETIPAIVNRLHGKIILIRGNHESEAKIKIYKELGIPVKDIDYIKFRGCFFILCHFPITNKGFMDMVRKDNNGVIDCYGHVHSKAPHGFIDGTYHVGVDTNDLTPVCIDKIWSDFQKENGGDK